MMLNKEHMRETILNQKGAKGLTWDALGQAIGKSPVYAAMLCYGYGQATDSEADALAKELGLQGDVRNALTIPPDRRPAGPWPPTDPFIYRFYEVVLLYAPVFKDICHEKFGDGIMSAIDMTIDLNQVKGDEGEDRVEFTLNGKWLTFKKF